MSVGGPAAPRGGEASSFLRKSGAHFLKLLGEKGPCVITGLQPRFHLVVAFEFLRVKRAIRHDERIAEGGGELLFLVFQLGNLAFALI